MELGRLNPELNLGFQRTRLQSVELIVEALDISSRTASQYGRRGKKGFEANQDPTMEAMRLLECMSVSDAEVILIGPLKAWLADPPEFDPEGWALPLYGKF